MFVAGGHSLGPNAADRLARALEYLVEVWPHEDSSIWELPTRRLYTQGKLASWIAFDRGIWLAEKGELEPGDERLERWRGARDEIAAYIDERCWSEKRQTYTRCADDESELDASVLLLARCGFREGREERLRSTIDAIETELGAGEGLLYRYSGQRDAEGAFVACSFWLVEALVAVGEGDRATQVMDELVAHCSDLGLLSEEIDPESGEFLGNLPQGLSHLALINAAYALAGQEIGTFFEEDEPAADDQADLLRSGA